MLCRPGTAAELQAGNSECTFGDDDFAQQLAADWTGIADPLKTTSPYERHGARLVRVRALTRGRTGVGTSSSF